MGKHNKVKYLPEEPRLPADTKKYEHDKGGGWRFHPAKDEDLRTKNKLSNIELYLQILKGFYLAFTKIEEKVPGITIQDFQITKFDSVKVTLRSGKQGQEGTFPVIFPVEMKAEKDGFSLTIDFDYPSKEEVNPPQGVKPLEGPHGPHVGYEIASQAGKSAGHIIVDKVKNEYIRQVPSRARKDQSLKNALNIDDKKHVVISRDQMFSFLKEFGENTAITWKLSLAKENLKEIQKALSNSGGTIAHTENERFLELIGKQSSFLGFSKQDIETVLNRTINGDIFFSIF
jgi:hypothetical protein